MKLQYCCGVMQWLFPVRLAPNSNSAWLTVARLIETNSKTVVLTEVLSYYNYICMDWF